MQLSRITVDQVHDKLRRNESVQLVDVRERGEFADEHILGSINAPLSEFAEIRHTFRPEDPIYLICKSGKKAEVAATFLSGAGFTEIFIVAGGILAWMVQRFPLHRPVF